MNQLLKTLGVLVLCLVLMGPDVALAHDTVSHPNKSYFLNEWYQTVQNGNYSAWMTLSTHRHYDDATHETWGKPLFDKAIPDWNAGSHTVLFQEYSSTDEAHDVHAFATSRSSIVHWSKTIYLDTAVSGAEMPFGKDKEPCLASNTDTCVTPNGDGKIWYDIVYIRKDNEIDGYYDESVASHEFGHSAQLAHDGIGNSTCGGTIPRTVMDYDCMNYSIVNSALLSQAWDVCGLNHKYPDPNYGQAKCDQLQY